jgi:hypothetical protein
MAGIEGNHSVTEDVRALSFDCAHGSAVNELDVNHYRHEPKWPISGFLRVADDTDGAVCKRYALRKDQFRADPYSHRAFPVNLPTPRNHAD